VTFGPSAPDKYRDIALQRRHTVIEPDDSHFDPGESKVNGRLEIFQLRAGHIDQHPTDTTKAVTETSDTHSDKIKFISIRNSLPFREMFINAPKSGLWKAESG
jgi:hypothetical protein